ncbi:MAG: hypothetical protein ACE5G2_02800 [Candidatus Krumholzibacteriia bacterium]
MTPAPLMRPVLPAACLLALAAAWSPAASAQRGDRPDSLRSAPIYGVTDTTRVTTRKLTLREIIARCHEGEKTKLGGHTDMTYTMTIRAIVRWKKKKEIRDEVFRGYADADGTTRIVKLDDSFRKYELRDGSWVLDEDADEEESRVEVSASAHSDFAKIPFFLEDEHEFDFTLLERTVEVDHVIFKIGFKPKSDFKALPSGTVYVDTDNYRIIHEQFTFEQSPFPLFLKGIKRISRHWSELPGGEWVATRLFMDIDLRGGWFDAIPDNVALALHRDDFRFDEGYDARIFGER